MIRLLVCMAAALGVFAAAAGVEAAPPTIPAYPPPPGSAVPAAAGTAKLAWELVRASGVGNAILSPASVWEALAMTHAGAKGETAAEIAGVLGVADNREQIAAAAADLRKLLAEAKGEKIKLDVANRIWAQRGKALEAGFTGLLEAKFGAAAGIVDFAGQPEDARAEINAWVGGHTADKIPELLKSGTITPLTRLVLTNAIYMKAPWATPFEKSATRPEASRWPPATRRRCRLCTPRERWSQARWAAATRPPPSARFPTPAAGWRWCWWCRRSSTAWVRCSAG